MDRLITNFKASGVNLPPHLKATFAPLLCAPQLSTQTHAVLKQAEALSAEFLALQAATEYRYLDGEGGHPAHDYSSPDRSTRERAFRAIAAGQVKAAEPMRPLFVKLHQLRQQAAQLEGLPNFTALAWQMEPLTERDYTQREVQQLRAGVRRYIIPLLNEVRAFKAKQLGLTHLAPWDDGVSVGGLKPVPFIEDTRSALTAASEVLHQLFPEFGQMFDTLREHGAFDVEVREGKTGQAYSDYLPIERLPYLQMQLDVKYADYIHLFFHEIGHVLHKGLTDEKALFRQYFPPQEVAEFVAQAFEVLTLPYLSAFFKEKDLKVLTVDFIESLLSSLVSTVILDEFQEEIYSILEVNEDELDALYRSVTQRYPTGIDAKLSEHLGIGWTTWQVFTRPFYSIEYAFAWLAVIQLWDQADQRPRSTVQAFAALMNHPFESTSSALSTAGVTLVSTHEDIETVTASLRRRWQTLITF